jgi:hypothetical protein
MKKNKPWKPSLWRRFKRWEPIYWLRTHTIDRYHLLDLRGQGDYTWGYLDPCHKMWLACFAVLCEFVEKEDPKIGSRTVASYFDLGPTGRPCEKMQGIAPSKDDDSSYFYDPPSDEIRKERDWWEGEQEQIEYQLGWEREVRFLYDWWKTGRAKDHAELDEMGKDINMEIRFKEVPGRDDVKELDMSHLNHDTRWKEWCKRNDELEKKDEEMLRRLIEVRGHLWT